MKEKIGDVKILRPLTSKLSKGRPKSDIFNMTSVFLTNRTTISSWELTYTGKDLEGRRTRETMMGDTGSGQVTPLSLVQIGNCMDLFALVAMSMLAL
jgi:hypothetical protein